MFHRPLYCAGLGPSLPRRCHPRSCGSDLDLLMLTVSLFRQGTQGIMDTASKGLLEDEFGTSRDEEVVKQILERGSVVESEVGFGHSYRRTCAFADRNAGRWTR